MRRQIVAQPESAGAEQEPSAAAAAGVDAGVGAGAGGGGGAGGAGGRSGGERDVMQTEFAFRLPRGYVDGSGQVHREGVMRLSTARDELVPLRDDRVRENPAYLSVVLLGRVVVRLGTLTDIHAGVIEDMFASDLAFLQDFYRRINAEGHTRAQVTCPSCATAFAVDLAGERLGES
ncbi:hypothetical protein [Actinacidiphila epipremni]|uniref:Secreted protein n=1 Tax=Actinacidiphila epipremni TaxID=2053013 RepID=A0ABX0ZV80_9ACTN|nr:hypothetical protein [Actinacidiphila epipremni]NJP46557.1 hypothetical protein [Actinacidiphila epipremni]